MIIIPDPATANMDPFYAQPTLSLTCDIVDPITKQPYSRDPRNIARKAEKYLKSDRHRRHVVLRPRGRVLRLRRRPLLRGHRTAPSTSSTRSRARWNTGREEGPNLGYKPANKGGYFPVPPTDTLDRHPRRDGDDARGVGIEVEVCHHEVATGGQCEMS